MSDFTLTWIYFDCCFKLLKKSFSQGLKNSWSASHFLENKNTFRTLQKLLVQLPLDKIDASYNIIEVGNVLFLRSCTRNQNVIESPVGIEFIKDK